jgi:hypothetical protein
MHQPAMLQEEPDFSLVLGGPLFQLFRWAHLSGGLLELSHRRIILITVIAWLPLLVLSSLAGHAVDDVALPFLRDIETQVRFLLAVPVLIAAELIVHARIRPVVQSFVKRNIVIAEDLPRFHAALNSATRWRNSIPVEVGLLIFVCTVGQWLWRSQFALGTKSWYGTAEAGHLHLTWAGYWMAFVANPLFQFILLRWYYRLLVWFRFLWRVSRLHLHLVPTHPDRTAGLAFLGKSSYAFSPILFAQGILLAGMIASRVLYGGQSLLAFKLETVGLIGFFLLVILGPLTMFTPQLARAKRQGLADYGLLANQYVERFENKWVRGTAAPYEEVLGAADIQSLADLDSSYAIVREMRAVPFGIQDITRLAVATAVPLVPLGLTIFSLEELVIRLLKVVF